MPERQERRLGGFPLAAVILVGLGILFLLQNLDVLPWDLWAGILRFWPVILILVGVNIIIGRTRPWLAALITLLALIGVVVGAAVWYQVDKERGVVTTVEEPLAGATQGRVELRFGAGELQVNALPQGSTLLASARFDGPGGGSRVGKTATRSGDTLELKLESRRSWAWPSFEGERWEIGLAQAVPLALVIKAGASNLELDLTELKVTELELEIGASNADIVLPRSAGNTRAAFKAGAADLEIRVPEGVAAKIRIKSGISSVDVDEQRFPKSGDFFLSPDFNSAANRVELTVDAGAAHVEIR